MSDDRDTPTSPHLIEREEAVQDYGNGGPKKTRKLPKGMSPQAYAEAAYEAAERASATALECFGAVGQLTAEIGGIRQDVTDLKHIAITGKMPPPRPSMIPPPRAPAPSFSSLSTDDG